LGSLRAGGGPGAPAPEERRLGSAIGWYALATVLILGRVLIHPWTATVPSAHGAYGDQVADFWNLWWVHQALSTGQSLFETRLLYFPTGTSLRFVEFGPLYGFLSVPFFVISDSGASAVLAHNLWVTLSFILTATATYLLAWRESGSRIGSLLAGFLVAFSAFRFHHLEHLNLLSFYWIPLCGVAAAAWLWGPETSDGPRWRRLLHRYGPALALFACGWGVSLTSWTILIMTAVFLTLWVGVSLIAVAERRRRDLVWRLPAAVLLMAVGPTVLLWPILIQADPFPSLPMEQAARFSPDLFAFFAPQQSLALGPLVVEYGRHLHGVGGHNMYLGVTLLGLAVVGSAQLGRRAAPWLATVIVAWGLALGPELWILKNLVTPPVSLYRLLAELFPPLSMGRVPERWVIVVLVALAPLAAIGMRRLLGSRRRRWWLAAASALAFLELFPGPVPSQPVSIPAVYRQLNDDPDPGAVLELSSLSMNAYLYYQIQHRRPLVSGPFKRYSAAAEAFQTRAQFHRRMLFPETRPLAASQLRQIGVRYVICHRSAWKPEVWDGLIEGMSALAPVYARDEKTLIFRLGE
jgi:hypothetical protein